ncbi:hypothetical protein LTR47_005732 [Exophiala xenobiotica]|nr:hypothetical protein LTR47_005732 [Exophiala xenobiotica]KAK5243038.1 hypothetical protein LTS06_011109 [Exophiala xenobiotica]KAK5351091.1 hypothetical protein LTR61_005444 [Exophiala xenobiotica]KAK5374322.1 hypothetical protein LTR11_005529 [Exophiala xenobiotica]
MASKEIDTVQVTEPSPDSQAPSELADQREIPRRRFLGMNLPLYFSEDKERTLVRKFDTFLLSYTALSVFMQSLDNSNISNAYVSGMKEDLNVKGNEYNYMSTTFNCGIITGAVPLMLLSTRIRPSILMPACELSWSILVMGIAGAQNVSTVFGLRYGIGFLQGIAFPGFAQLLGGWYTPSELGKRMAIYEVSSSVAGMFSGYIESGLYQHMNGKGMAAWRWLFIFDGVISIPIALYGFYALADSPHNTRARWLKPEDLALANERMDRVGRRPVLKITWKRFKSIWSTWHVYMFVICYTCYGAFSWGDSYFNLWLVYLDKYTVPEINNIPTAGPAAALVNSIISGFLSDYLRNRPLVIVINMFICLFGNIFVAIWTAPTALKFLGYIMITMGLPAQSQTIAWLNEVCQGNGTLRGLIVSIGNTLVYALTSWDLVVLFPASKAPHYKAGYQVCAAVIGLAVISVGVILWLIKRDLKTGKAYRNESGLLEYEKWIQAVAEGDLPVTRNPAEKE